MQPKILSLPYHPQAVHHWFNKLQSQTWAMLLSSSQAEHPDSRYDIMTADPISTLITRGEDTLIISADEQKILSDDPLVLVEAALNALPIVDKSKLSLPFVGGALGLFGYDLARHFELLPNLARQDLTTPDMAVGIYDWALIADHHQKKLTLVSLDNCEKRFAWLEAQQAVSETSFRLTAAWQSNLTQAQYYSRFTRVQQHLAAGDCYQINLAQRFQAPYRGSEWQAFCRLSQTNRAPFSAFLRLPDSAILSLSPERFLAVKQNIITTKPIKGTLPRLTDPQADRLQANKLANSEKDRAENLMIVDLLRNDIGREALPGSVEVPQLFSVEAFPAVHHLVSTITGKLPDSSNLTQLLRSCFPGGSITGAPKVRAMEIIDTLEPNRRNAWCGSIGYLSRCGAMDTNITIRTLIAEDQQLYCAAGGGIVADSQAAAEYQETFDKVSQILPILSAMGTDAS